MAPAFFGLGDNDTWWTAVDTSAFVWQVSALGSAGQYLFAVTYDGIWRRPLSDIVLGVKTANEELPTEFRLEQNYPNPFSAGRRLPASRQGSASGGNPTTTIGYTIGGVVALSGARLSGVEGRMSTNVRLAVYDILGRQVATLVNEPKAPGNYEVTFDGSGLASGVYIYRLTAGSFVQSLKMLLVR